MASKRKLRLAFSKQLEMVDDPTIVPELFDLPRPVKKFPDTSFYQGTIEGIHAGISYSRDHCRVHVRDKLDLTRVYNTIVNRWAAENSGKSYTGSKTLTDAL